MGRYLKGQSGNPAGKPKGAGSRSTEIRNILHASAADLARKAIDMALEGDGTALKICIERLCPALRPKDLPTVLPWPEAGTLTERGHAVMQAVADGHLTASEAASLLNALANQAKLIEIDELSRRLEALEQSQPEPTDVGQSRNGRLGP